MTNLERQSRDARVTVRKSGAPDPEGKCVVYWMQHAQRALDNPALDLAVRVANELALPTVVFFAPVPFYPRANIRHYHFLVQGIPDIQEALSRRNIGFVLRAYPEHCLARFCEEVKAAIVVGDENPLRETEDWRRRAARKLRVPLWTVDADVIVPTKLLEKEQFAARTIRPRIHKLLLEFLIPHDNTEIKVPWAKPAALQSIPLGQDFMKTWILDRSVSPVGEWTGGSKQGTSALKKWLKHGLTDYSEKRNHPEVDGTSRLSPYLHFGQISPITIALAVQNTSAPKPAEDAFLEQLIVRRELSVNFVRFNKSYDSMESLEPWACRTIAEHVQDPRPVLYSEKQLDQAETHDPLWNAAQKQMVLTGWMHNYMRMYWAKKILEWSPSIAIAYRRAVWLNDRYLLDGRDPNGYAGIAWAVVGKHDRAWSERPIFGKIRYMSLASTAKKFNSKQYMQEIQNLERAPSSIINSGN